MADNTILCQRGKITVAVYRSMIQQKKKPEIAQFIHLNVNLSTYRFLMKCKR
jgi:hypothetical protein